MTGPVRLDREAVENAVRNMIERERSRVDDLGASIPGADPDDVHGWHASSSLRHPCEPGMPLFRPEAWRFFRLLDLGWLGNDVMVGFAWDELGTPDLRYLTRMRFMSSDLDRDPHTLALNVRMHLRYLLGPTDGAATRTASWRYRCARLWLGPEEVLVGHRAAVDQEHLDAGWELAWPSLTNPPWPDPSEDEPPDPSDQDASAGGLRDRGGARRG